MRYTKQIRAMTRNEKKLRKIIEALRKAEHKTLAQLLDRALRLSSGRISSERLAKPVELGGYNHPYGLGPENRQGPRGPIPYRDPAKINRQTGVFYSSWKIKEPKVLKTMIKSQIYNDAPQADILHLGKPGYRGFIPRPIIQRIAEKTARDRIRNIFAELRNIGS